MEQKIKFDQGYLDHCFKVARERQQEVGDVDIPRLYPCAVTQKKYPREKMNLLKTDLVEEVVDQVCLDSAVEYEKELSHLCRLVCCGCKEAVRTFEPYKDHSGFTFEPGGVYHVANCPICKEGLKKSPILEMILFYQQNKIPYEL